MIISAIVAIDKKGGMGKAGGIPWKIPGEQKRFKDITMPHPMIMGRKTFVSIGRILPGRPHIIVSRDPAYHVEGAMVVSTVEEAIQKAKELDEDVFIIGGGQIFQEAMSYINRIYLTRIEHDFACDTFFPDYSEFTKVIEKEEHTEWEYPYTFLTLERPKA